MARDQVPSPAGPEPALAAVKALADPTRLRIFTALRHKERCVRDLAESEGVAQPLVSHHLKILAGAGLVAARRSEGFTFYLVDPRGMDEARLAIADLLDPSTLGPPARAGGNSDCCR